MEIVLPIIISSLLKGCVREDYNKSNKKKIELDSKDIITKCDITSNGLEIKWNKNELKLEDVSSYELLVYKKKDIKYQIYRQIDVNNSKHIYKDRYKYTPGTYKVTMKFYNKNLYNQTSIHDLHISSSKLKTINRQSRIITVTEYFVRDTIYLNIEREQSATYYINVQKKSGETFKFYKRYGNFEDNIDIVINNAGEFKFILYKQFTDNEPEEVDTALYSIKEKDIFQAFNVLKIDNFDSKFEEVVDSNDPDITRKYYIQNNITINTNNKIIGTDTGNLIDSIRFSPSSEYFLIIEAFGDDITGISFQLGTISAENNNTSTDDLNIDPLLDKDLGNIFDIGFDGFPTTIVTGSLNVKNIEGKEYILSFKNNSLDNKTVNVYFEQKPLIKNNILPIKDITVPYEMTLAGYTSDLIEFSVDAGQTNNLYLDFRFDNTNDRDIELYLYEKIENGDNILYAYTSTDDYEPVDEDNTKTKILADIILTPGNYILNVSNPDDDGRKISYGFNLDNTDNVLYKTIKPLQNPLDGEENQIQLGNNYYNNQLVDIGPNIFDEYRNIQIFDYVDSEPIFFTINDEPVPDGSIIDTNKYFIKFFVFGGLGATIELYNKDTGNYYFNNYPNNGTLFFVQNFRPGRYECKISQDGATPGSTTHSVFSTFNKYLDKVVDINRLPTFSDIKTNLASDYIDSNNNIIVNNPNALQGVDGDDKTYYLIIRKSDNRCCIIGYKKVGTQIVVDSNVFTTDLNNDSISFEAGSDVLQYNGYTTDPVSTYIMDIEDTNSTYTIKVKNIHNNSVFGPYTNFSQLNIDVCFYQTPDEQYNDVFNESTILAYNEETEDPSTIHGVEQTKELIFRAPRSGKYLIFVYAPSQLITIGSYDLEITSD